MQKNCIILGAGRSGTSLAAGLLSSAGYSYGGELLEAHAGNPRGFFEAIEVNRLNEHMLSHAIRARPRFFGRYLFQHLPRRAAHDRWLFPLDQCVQLAWQECYRSDLEKIVSRTPYCLKDPRFCYTLPLWRPFLQNVVYLCIFRHPALVVASTQKFLLTDPAFKNLCPSSEQLFLNYSMMYRHVLDRHATDGHWLFVHYEQLFEAEVQSQIASFIGCKVDPGFVDPQLRRTREEIEVPDSVLEIYAELKERSGL